MQSTVFNKQTSNYNKTRCRPNGMQLYRPNVPACNLAALQTMTTDDSQQNNTGPLGGPVIISRLASTNKSFNFMICKWHIFHLYKH